ncbi:hypothetical protein B0J18DRAFT_436593 [Chaetomium sp. MPI-SDFR-AT-0129]|nr:hypothetical protein B0J18DRAFT_436593 [Chaetomium sp. MPI-SDFR-AT-0129]
MRCAAERTLLLLLLRLLLRLLLGARGPCALLCRSAVHSHFQQCPFQYVTKYCKPSLTIPDIVEVGQGSLLDTPRQMQIIVSDAAPYAPPFVILSKCCVQERRRGERPNLVGWTGNEISA